MGLKLSNLAHQIFSAVAVSALLGNDCVNAAGGSETEDWHTIKVKSVFFPQHKRFLVNR